MFARSSSRLCSMLHVNKYYSPASGSKKRLFNHIRGFSTRKRDYYDVLGLKKGANKAEIKKSYFEMAKKYHPDVNKEKGADAKFKEVTEAYECLENDEKRGLYDNFGHEAVDGSNGGGQGNPFAGGFGGFQGGFGGFNVNMQEGAHMEDIFDILNGAFGNTPRRDIQSRVSLSFFEAVNGCNKTLEVEYIVTTGSRGKQRRERKKKKVTVDIPAGVDDNMVLRVVGEGSGESRSPGDLLLEIQVEPDSYFTRQGNDIYVEIPVPLTKAILGGAIDVLTLDGMLSVKIPPGTQPNSKLSLRDKGVKHANRAGRQVRGVQYIIVKVDIPKHLTARQRELLHELAIEEGNVDSSKEVSFIENAWNRLKTFMGAEWCAKNDPNMDNSKKENIDSGKKVADKANA